MSLTSSKLKNLLIKIGKLEIDSYNHKQQLYKYIKENPNNYMVISKNYLGNDSFKNKFPDLYNLDIEDSVNWSTYDKTGCISITYFIENDKLMSHIIIIDYIEFNGDFIDKMNLK